MEAEQPIAEVLKPGLLTTVQDLGRFGYLSLGIAESGAMDRWSLVAANRLLRNPDGAAALEITLLGPTIRFLAPTRFSLTGADLSAELEGIPLSGGAGYGVREGQVLSFGRCRRGFRAYLGLTGGIEVPTVLGSRSTYLYAGFGGLEGRKLAREDLLHGTPDSVGASEGPDGLPPVFLPSEDGPRTLRVIMGPHEDRFEPAGVETFLHSVYSITSESNRMGYRLAGPQIAHRASPIVVSEAAPPGAIQVPGQGLPVILLRERGTTGGYTKIGCVITPDLDVLAQLPPETSVRFQRSSLEEAHLLEQQRWQTMDAWRPAVGQRTESET